MADWVDTMVLALLIVSLVTLVGIIVYGTVKTNGHNKSCDMKFDKQSCENIDCRLESDYFVPGNLHEKYLRCKLNEISINKKGSEE